MIKSEERGFRGCGMAMSLRVCLSMTGMNVEKTKLKWRKGRFLKVSNKTPNQKLNSPC